MNTVFPDNLEQRLQQDAERIQVTADQHFTQRVSNRINAAQQQHNPGSSRNRRYWAWGLAVPAALAVVLLVTLNPLQQSSDFSPASAQLLVSNLDMNLDKALVERENDFESELTKVQNDLHKLGSMMGFNGALLVK